MNFHHDPLAPNGSTSVALICRPHSLFPALFHRILLPISQTSVLCPSRDHLLCDCSPIPRVSPPQPPHFRALILMVLTPATLLPAPPVPSSLGLPVGSSWLKSQPYTNLLCSYSQAFPCCQGKSVQYRLKPQRFIVCSLTGALIPFHIL